MLDMGELVKVVDLSCNLIRLSGYMELDIPIHETGIRPGEKLCEELLNDDEIQSEMVFQKIYFGRANPVAELLVVMEKLGKMSNENVKEELIGLANRKNVEFNKPLVTLSNNLEI